MRTRASSSVMVHPLGAMDVSITRPASACHRTRIPETYHRYNPLASCSWRDIRLVASLKDELRWMLQCHDGRYPQIGRRGPANAVGKLVAQRQLACPPLVDRTHKPAAFIELRHE